MKSWIRQWQGQEHLIFPDSETVEFQIVRISYLAQTYKSTDMP